MLTESQAPSDEVADCLNEYDKEEWWGIISTRIAPNLTREEFEVDWAENMALKAERQRQRGLS